MKVLRETGLDGETRVLYTSDHGDNTGARGLWGKSTMYRESVGVPLIISGPEVTTGRIERTAVSHIDIYNSVVDAVGLDSAHSTASPRSTSVFGPLDPDRVVLSEYHAVGSKSATFMMQNAEFKFVQYCERELPDELFDIRQDPEEMVNLASAREGELDEWRTRLQQLLDPDEVDARAKSRQQELIEYFGGRDSILARKGIGGFSPAPASGTMTP